MFSSFRPEFVAGKNSLSRDESHHLVAVRRARVGDPVRLLDGTGRIGTGTLTEANPKAAVVAVDTVATIARDTPPLWLAQALPLGKTMDTIVQKAAELGTARIAPLLTRYSEVRLDDARAGRKADKWLQVATEAVKQCGNPFLPHIDAPVRLADFLALPELAGLRLVASLEPGARSLTQAVRGGDTAAGVVVAIGPEGDFAPEEYALLRSHGFIPVTLGPLVLRADTAAIATLAIVSEALRG